jgi:hypothetical protein
VKELETTNLLTISPDTLLSIIKNSSSDT